MPDRPWVLLKAGPANTTTTVRQALMTPDLCHREPEFFDRKYAFRVANMGTLTPKDMVGVVEAFASCLAELGR